MNPSPPVQPKAARSLQRLLGAAVIAHRHGSHLTQEELAHRANLNRSYIADIERGARNPSLSTLEKLAGGLGIQLVTLLGEGKRARRAPSKTEWVDILMVEDNQGDIALLLRAFDKARIANRVHIVRDGAAALDFVFGSEGWAQAHSPDRSRMILLDLNLPGVQGLEVLRRFKDDERTRAIPVAVMTVSRDAKDMAECRRLGADAYIVKPVNLQRFCTAASQLAFHWGLLQKTREPRTP